MTRPAGAVEGLLADRYRLTERLAAGGMGEVWRAVDVLLERPVAVKTLRAELLDDEDFRARFRAEARHAARLSHPGVASVYDFGELPDRAWLVMELVDGQPLSALLREHGRLNADLTLDVVAQTAAALHAAHEVGVVHRDVKPGNLLVRPDGRVKVTDFGIASAADAAPLTRTGQLVGTASYLSPEQAAGGSGTPSSDLYALGVVAYECLAGVRPFVADSPLAVVLAHLQAPPPPLPGDVPAPVRALVERLLAKSPADRPPSGAELAREAEALRARVVAPGGAGSGLVGTAVPAADAPDVVERAAEAASAAVTRALPVPDALSAAPASAPVAALPRPHAPAGPASRRGQRWAVRATTVLLALLAGVLGLRGVGDDAAAVVPDIAVGTPEARASAALVDAGLVPVLERATSTSVPPGRVLSLRPGGGTELQRGDEVVLVVSSGVPTVRVSEEDLVGLGAAQASRLLADRGLVPELVEDGSGTPVGTVSAAAPVGDLPVGATVVLHVVPAPAPVVPAPVPAPAGGDGDAPAPDEGQNQGEGEDDGPKPDGDEEGQKDDKDEENGKGNGNEKGDDGKGDDGKGDDGKGDVGKGKDG